MTKTYLFLIINFILILSTLFFLKILIDDRLLFEEYNIDEFTNTFCDNSKSISCINKYKTNKFILLLSDGTAFDELPYIYKSNEHNLTSVFKNYDPEFKLTGGNFETAFTGKFSRNYFYHKIKTDNLFRQLHRNGYRLSYLGVEFPVFLYLDSERNVEFSKYIVEKDEENITFTNLCNVSYNIYDNNIMNYFKKISDKYLNTDKPRDEIFKFLDEAFKKENDYLLNKLNITECFIKQFDYNPNNKTERFGIIYYTTTLDNIHHSYSKKNWISFVNTYITNKYISAIHKWVNLNREFSLILFSDHGGNLFPGDETLTMHGSNVEGNEAIFSLYNKNLGENYDKLKFNDIKIINRYEYATTMPQIIEGINIPINSIGKPLLIGNDNIIRYSAVKSKEEQVISFLKNGRIKFKEFFNLFQKWENDIKKGQNENVDLYNDNYYDDRINYLIDIHVKAFKMISGKINIYHLFLFICVLVILIIFIWFEYNYLKEIFDDDSKNQYNKIFIFCIIYFIPNLLLFCFTDLFHVSTRLRFGYFFQCFVVSIFIFFIKCENYLISIIKNIFIISVFIILILYNSFFYIKMFFSYYEHNIIISFIYYPIFTYYVNYEIKKQKLNSIYFGANKKYSCENLIFYLSIIFLTFLFIFDIIRIGNSTSNILTTLIGFFFVLFIILNNIIVLYGKGKLINNFPLTKLITFYISIYLLNEADKLILILVIPIFEIMLNQIEKKLLLKDKIFTFINLIFFCDILNLYTRLNLFPKINPTIKLRYSTFPLIKFLNNIMVNFNENIYFLILSSYIHSISNLIYNQIYKDQSIIIRLFVYLKFSLIIIYSLYNVFIQKNQNEFIYLIHLCLIGFNFSIVDNLWAFGFMFIKFIKNKLLIEDDKYENISSKIK